MSIKTVVNIEGMQQVLVEILTCYLLNCQLRSKALNADIGPKLVQLVFERINRWSIDNFLREPIPFTNPSLTKEVFSTVESASVHK